MPVESIAEDLLGLAVEARELEVSGMLLPAERRILVNAAEPETRRRFTIAHELGHWVCQCVGAESPQPVYCRAEEVGVDPEARALEREANIFAANLVMPEAAVRDRRRGPVRGERRGACVAALQPRTRRLGAWRATELAVALIYRSIFQVRDPEGAFLDRMPTHVQSWLRFKFSDPSIQLRGWSFQLERPRNRDDIGVGS